MKVSRSDRRALTLVLTVVATAFCAVVLDRFFLQTDDASFTIDEIASDTLEKQVESVAGSFSADNQSPIQPQRTVETFAFDPNTADSTTLLRLGLAPWQVRAMYNYRNKGGRYHRPEDFKRVPGMTPELYERLAPYITIARQFRLYSDLEAEERDSSKLVASKIHSASGASKDSSLSAPSPQYQEKFREPIVLDLNTVDTSTLKMVPGIGSYRARRIVEYRARLGGYTDVEQLSDIEGLPEELKAWFAVESPIFAPVLINSAELKQLAHHPYISYAQARAIIAYRKTYGRIDDIESLALSGTFSAADLARLKPYIKY